MLHSSGRWFFGSQRCWLSRKREHALLGARLLLVAARAAERGVELVLRERRLQRLGLHHVRVARAVGERADARLRGLDVRVHDQVEAELARHAVAERDHLPELPGRVDVHQRERQLARVERLAGQVQEHRAVLADRVQHDRVVELGRHLADDVDALRLEALELRHVRRKCLIRRLVQESLPSHLSAAHCAGKAA